jgi:DNA-binding CsgD family transcriptional regulator
MLEAEVLISKISTCESQGYLDILLQEIFAVFGVSSFLFITLLKDSKNRDSFRFQSGCDPNWFNLYNHRKWHEIDPFIAYGKLFSKPILLSDMVGKSDGSRGSADYFENIHNHGFKSGLVIPCHSVSTKRMGVLIVGNDLSINEGDEKLKMHRVSLRSIGYELLDWWIDHLQAKVIDKSKLKQQDLSLLKMAYNDLSASDMGLSIGLNVSQVNNRFRNINALFQVDNKKEAAILAMEYGIIAPY